MTGAGLDGGVPQQKCSPDSVGLAGILVISAYYLLFPRRLQIHLHYRTDVSQGQLSFYFRYCYHGRSRLFTARRAEIEK